MNKKEAMEFLGKKERQLANYVSSGRLPVDYIAVKGIRTADYKPEDVARLKTELDAESRPAPLHSTPLHSATNAIPAPANAPMHSAGGAVASAPLHNATSARTIATNAIARVQPPLQGGQGSGESFVEILTQSLTESLTVSLKTVAASDPASLTSKMLLTIPEAIALSGLKEKPIRDAIKTGKLPAIRIGRSTQVRPSDLQRWVDGQFNN